MVFLITSYEGYEIRGLSVWWPGALYTFQSPFANSLVGLCCNCLRFDEPLFDFVGHTEDDRQDFMYKMMQASNTCISFCEDAGQLSDLALWALLENGIYNSQVLGDAHYLTWRKIGDLSTAIFAQGYHQESKDASRLPFWLIEMRRRALGRAYSIDKLLCTFVGRPPRISNATVLFSVSTPENSFFLHQETTVLAI